MYNFTDFIDFKKNMARQNNLAIVIPAYKATFLAAALDSIAAQTCQDFTLYIGDDCSPNKLEEIVDKYRDKINLVYNRFDTNLGGKDLVAQWERCIYMTQGEEWLWLFSDDDVMEKNCVEEFYKLPIDIRNRYIVHFNVITIDEFKHGLKKRNPQFPQVLNDFDFISLKTKGKINSYVIEYIFPRKVYQKCNGFQNFDLAWGSDILTWMKFAGACNGIYTICNCVEASVEWRSSDANISPDNSKPVLSRKMMAIIENAAFVQDYLVKHQYGRHFKVHAKAVLGELMRNSKYFSNAEIIHYFTLYRKKVGFRFINYVVMLYVLLFKKRIK